MQDDTRGLTVLTPAAAPERVLHADPHDFAGLYVRHRSSLTTFARRRLNDVRDADEVVQEAFLRLFLALPELETEAQALAYCRRTITNLCIDRYRADARRPNLVDLESVPQETFADADRGDPVVREQDAALVREALSMLPDLHRAALVKREVEEKPLPVIADELAIPEDNVKHLLFRARRALRKLLAGTDLAPGADVERAGGLAGTPRGGLAGLLVLLALALGSGPDLEAVPVVGVDLPDVIGVTRLTDAVVEAVDDVVDAIAPGREADALERPAPAPDAVSSSGAGAPADADAEGSSAPAGAAGGAARPAGGTSAGVLSSGSTGTPGSGATSTAPAGSVLPGGPAPASAVATAAPGDSSGATSGYDEPLGAVGGRGVAPPVSPPAAATRTSPRPVDPGPAASRVAESRQVAPQRPARAAARPEKAGVKAGVKPEKARVKAGKTQLEAPRAGAAVKAPAPSAAVAVPPAAPSRVAPRASLKVAEPQDKGVARAAKETAKQARSRTTAAVPDTVASIPTAPTTDPLAP